MVTLHEVITFLVSMQISISSLQTHNVNRCGRSRHLARKLSLRRKRSEERRVGKECRSGWSPYNYKLKTSIIPDRKTAENVSLRPNPSTRSQSAASAYPSA